MLALAACTLARAAPPAGSTPVLQPTVVPVNHTSSAAALLSNGTAPAHEASTASATTMASDRRADSRGLVALLLDRLDRHGMKLMYAAGRKVREL